MEDVELDKLLETRNSIEEDYTALNNLSNPIYQEHLRQLEKIYENKMAAVEQWRENEHSSAEKYYRSQIHGINNDYEEKMSQVVGRLNDFLAFKFQLLQEKFPEAAAYFESQGYKWPVPERVQKPALHMTPDVEIEISDQPLMTQNQVEEDTTAVSSIMEGRVNPEMHLKGLQVGDPALLTLPRLPPLRGTIGAISEDHFEFNRESGKVLTISFSSLELNRATIVPIE